MAEKLTIQFEAKGAGALKGVIEQLHAANVRLTEGEKAFEQIQKKLIVTNKKLVQSTKDNTAELLKADVVNRQQGQTLKDLERIKQKEIKSNIIAKDTKRANTLAIKKENIARKATLRALKQDIIARSKLSTTTLTLSASTNTTNKSLFALNHSARNTAGAFSVLRSKMLLVSFAVGLMVNSFKKLVDASAEVEEVLNKVTVVFGDQAQQVIYWAETFGNSIGRATDELLKLASTFQDTLVPMGATRDTATAISISLTKLALDVASFNNKLDADVVRDFQSAMVGNHETVRKYGIVITESALKAKAFEMGLYSGKGALTESAKLQARLTLITEGSSDAIGDLERTQDSYTNQTKKLNAELRESAIELGDAIKTHIMPHLLRIGILFSDTRRLKAYALTIGIVALAYKRAAIQTAYLSLTTGRLARGYLVMARGFKTMKIQMLVGTKTMKGFNLSMMVSRKGMKSFILGLKTMGTAFITSTAGIGLIVMALAELYMWLTRTEDQTQYLLDTYGDLSLPLEETEYRFRELKNESKELSESIIKLSESINESVQSLSHELAVSSASTSFNKRAIQITKNREGGVESLTKAEELLINAMIERERSIKAIAEAEKDAEKGLDVLQKAELEILKIEKNRLEGTVEEIKGLKTVEEATIKSNENTIKSNKNAASINTDTLTKYVDEFSKSYDQLIKDYGDPNQEYMNTVQIAYDQYMGDQTVENLEQLYDQILQVQNNYLDTHGQAEKDHGTLLEKTANTEYQKYRWRIGKTEKRYYGDLAKLRGKDYVLYTEYWSHQASITKKMVIDLNSYGKVIDDTGDATTALITTLEGQIKTQQMSNTELVESEEKLKLLNDALDIELALLGLAEDAYFAKAQSSKGNNEETEKLIELEKVHNKLLIESLKFVDIHKSVTVDAYSRISDSMGGVVFSTYNMMEAFSRTGDAARNLGTEVADLFREQKKLIVTGTEGVVITEELAAAAKTYGIELKVGTRMTAEQIEQHALNIETTSEAIGQKDAIIEATTAVASAFIESSIAASQASINMIKNQASAEMETLRASNKYRKSSDKEKKKLEKEITDEANKDIVKKFETQQDFAKAAVIMDTARAIQKVFAEYVGDPVSIGAWTGAILAMSIMQLSTINSQKPPKMAKGGLVGGRLHSQGGTLLEAEAGEYVMSREAVDTLGIETMNRINQGGGGAVNVNFTGNVLSNDFIENEAIPQIKEAIRRGADIGIS